MRVLQLTQRFPPAIGGVEDHVLHLAAGLRRSGVDVQVATTDLRRDTPFERLPPSADAYGFPVRRHRAWKFAEVPHGLGIATPSMLLDALDAHADLLHAHAYGTFPTWAGSFARSLDGAALVVTTHSDRGRRSTAKRAFDRLVPRFTLRQASRVIALTRHEAGFLASLGVEEDRIAVIPNGIDLAEFSGFPSARLPRTGVTALFAGRLDPSQKGLEFLVRALAALPRAADVRVRLVGEDWGAAGPLGGLAERLGVADRLTFVGPVPRKNLLEEYARADLFVLPSLFEPFGIVLLEAMAAGLPVVATRVGGIPEVVADGETALLVEPADAAELGAAILRLAESPERRVVLGARGRQRARAYSWDALVPRVLEVYRQAIEERG